MARRKPESQSSKLDEPVPVSPTRALENLDRMFDHVINVSNKTVKQRMARAKSKRRTRRNVNRASK
jgi:hypothetical protein